MYTRAIIERYAEGIQDETQREVVRSAISTIVYDKFKDTDVCDSFTAEQAFFGNGLHDHYRNLTTDILQYIRDEDFVGLEYIDSRKK